MKKFLVSLLVVLCLLFIPLTSYAWINIIPKVIFASCSSDDCVILWKVTIQNEGKNFLKGDLIVIVTDKDENIIDYTNVGSVSLKESETKIVSGFIMIEKTEKSKDGGYISAIMKDVVYYEEINTKPFLKFLIERI